MAITEQKTISFHPKLAAGAEVILGATMLWWLGQISSAWVLGIWFLFRIILWAALIRLVYYPSGASRLRHFFSLLVFYCGASLLLLFIDWKVAWYLVGAMFVFFPAFSFWLLPAKESEFTFVFKPERRFRFLMCIVGVAGIWGGIGAIESFQVYTLWLGWWLLFGSVITAVISAWWWREYGAALGRKFWAWTVSVFIVMMELSWVIFLWPIGYFATGMLLAWFWYLFWLLARFYLSPDGINWKRQTPFLIINGLLILFFLTFLARWK